MNLDLIVSIELTASASVAIATTALLLGRTTRMRFFITAVLALWFGWAVWLCTSSILAPQSAFGLPALGLSVVTPVIAFFVAINRIPTIKAALREAPLNALVALHAIRVLGVSFILLKAAGRLAPTFASVAGWGDISVGLLAIPLSWALTNRQFRGRFLVWVWNSLGLLDLAAAIFLGVASSPTPHQLIFETPTTAVMTTLPWFLIPGFLVPLLASAHFGIFWRLRQSEKAVSDERDMADTSAPTSVRFAR